MPTSCNTLYRWAIGLLALSGVSGPMLSRPLPATATNQLKLILVTIDGLRWQELFRDADPAIATDVTFTPDAIGIASTALLALGLDPDALLPGIAPALPVLAKGNDNDH